MAIDNAISNMIGKTPIAIRGGTRGDEDMLFIMSDGAHYCFYHSQDCCETVEIEDVCGDIYDLLDSPLLQAEEVSYSQNETPPGCDGGSESFTWTFYKFATIKGSVTVRWLGTSNGYYSEAVSIRESYV